MRRRNPPAIEIKTVLKLVALLFLAAVALGVIVSQMDDSMRNKFLDMDLQTETRP